MAIVRFVREKTYMKKPIGKKGILAFLLFAVAILDLWAAACLLWMPHGIMIAMVAILLHIVTMVVSRKHRDTFILVGLLPPAVVLALLYFAGFVSGIVKKHLGI